MPLLPNPLFKETAHAYTILTRADCQPKIYIIGRTFKYIVSLFMADQTDRLIGLALKQRQTCKDGYQSLH